MSHGACDLVAKSLASTRLTQHAGGADKVTDWAHFVVQHLVTGTHSATTLQATQDWQQEATCTSFCFCYLRNISERVMTLLQAVAGVVVAWRKKIQAVGWGVRRPPQAGGGARQSLIRQV